jgi:tetratricopeptide (TPR) repeat protein
MDVVVRFFRLLLVAALVGGAQAQGPPACDAARSTELASRARTALAGGDASMAAKLFLDAYEACHLQPLLLVEAGRALTAARRFDQALATLDRFLAENPNSLPGHLARANALLMAQRWADCGAEIEQALQIGRDHRDLLLLKAHYEYLVGESGKAEQTLLRLLDLYPEDEEAAYALGRIYYMDSRIDYASAQFQRVLRLNPKSYKAWDNLGLCYDAAGETDKAVQHFLKAIELAEKADPGYDWPYGNLADLLFRQNDFERSYHAAVQAAKRNPHSARNFYLGGKALARLNRNEEAIQWLERSAALDSTYPDPLYLLGQLYMKMGRKDQAAQALQKFRQVKAKAPAQRR